LQVLMQCIDGPGRWWDASTMARETGISGAAAERALDHLARKNLLDIRVTAEVRYTFSPGTDALRDEALAFAAAYRSRPVGVIQLITEDRRSHIRDFAEAFRIRRHDDS